MGPGSPHLPSTGLTRRERECLRLAHQGLGSKEIATVLGLSPHTIDNHIKRALSRLGVSDRRLAARMVAAEEASDPLIRDWLHQTLAMVRAGGEVLHHVAQEQQQEADRESIRPPQPSTAGRPSAVDPSSTADLADDLGLGSAGRNSGSWGYSLKVHGRVSDRWIGHEGLFSFRTSPGHRNPRDRGDPGAGRHHWTRVRAGRSPSRFERLIVVIAAVCGLLMTATLVINGLTLFLHAIDHQEANTHGPR